MYAGRMATRAAHSGSLPARVSPLPVLAPSRRSTLLGETSPRIQRKLTIGRPNDRFEQEADRVADQVMRMPDPHSAVDLGVAGVGRASGIQRICTECQDELQRQPLEEEEEELQAKPQPGAIPALAPTSAAGVDALRGGGEALSPALRSFYEPRFGHDFGHVRVHTDARAAESARDIKARAFTLGSDVVFGRGEFRPGSSAGRQLLAHELTHVVQQGAAARRLRAVND